MPGIYTHNFIFRRSVENVIKNHGRSGMMRSLEILFSDREHMRAGYFGAIGPDIFDYMNIWSKGGIYGSELSFSLHDSGCSSFIGHMSDIITSQKDSRNEWASIQKSYLLGYISHVLADAVLNPFIFYFSGFPSTYTRSEIIRCRIANLRFGYNIDNYYLYRSELSVPYNMSVDEMLPDNRLKERGAVWPQVKVLLLESLKRENGNLFGRYFAEYADRNIDGDVGRIRSFDRIPDNIRLCYRLRRTGNERIMNILDRMRENPVTYSDFFVRYPLPKAVDQDALNIHQARWQYPAFQRGFRYESVPQLVKLAVDQITDVWEKVEGAANSGKRVNIADIFSYNAYTGEKEALYSDMKIKDVIKLKI